MSASCYGKLPIFADFIRHNAGGAEVQQFDQWLQESIYLARQSLGPRWDALFDRLPASRFVYRPAGSPRFMIGVTVPGTDKAGRKYPFSIFHSADAAPFERDAALLPAAFDGFLEEAQSLAVKGWVGGDMKALLGKVETLRPAGASAREGYEKFLAGTKASDFWTALFGSFEHPAKAQVLGNLRDMLAGLSHTPLGKLAYGLKFPLPASLGPSSSLSYEACFWLDLTFRLVGQAVFPPLVFWNQRGTSADPSLYLFFNNPSPRYFVPLLRRDVDSDHVADLTKGGDPSKFKSAYGAALDDASLPLGELAKKLVPK